MASEGTQSWIKQQKALVESDKARRARQVGMPIPQAAARAQRAHEMLEASKSAKSTVDPKDKRAGDIQKVKQHTAQPVPPKLPRELSGAQAINPLPRARPIRQTPNPIQSPLPVGREINPLPPAAQLPQNVAAQTQTPAVAVSATSAGGSTKLAKATLAEQAKQAKEGRLTREAKREQLQKIGAAETTIQNLQTIPNNVLDGLTQLPTPGSIAAPLIILSFLFFLVLPVNGMTRLQWLWLVITGNAQVTETATSTTSGATGSGPPLGVNFGSGPAQADVSINPGGIVADGNFYMYDGD